MVDLKILQSDWLRAFWPIPQEQDFSQTYHLCRNTTNNINFHYRSNSVKILIHFPNLGQKSFSKNSGSATHNLINVSSTMPKFRVNLMIKLQENTNKQQDRRLDRPYFIGPFWLLQGVQQVQLQ